MITPRQLGRMLAGKGLNESRRRRPPLPTWVPDPGATHPSQGHFMTADETPAPAPAVTLERVDQAAAELLAAEAKRLAVPR